MTYREIKLVLKTILWTVFALFMLWCCWSYVDVIIHQDCGGTQNALNLFRVLLRA